MFAGPLSGMQHAKFPALFLTDVCVRDVPKPTKESGDSQSFCSLAINPRRARAPFDPKYEL